MQLTNNDTPKHKGSESQKLHNYLYNHLHMSLSHVQVEILKYTLSMRISQLDLDNNSTHKCLDYHMSHGTSLQNHAAKSLPEHKDPHH